MASFKPAAAAALCLVLTACGTKQAEPPRPAQMPKTVKIGKTYTVLGQTYTPSYQPEYDETGTASWYGPGFHGGKTATGETFDHNDLTAAHRTLPMPSMVRVTNLNNGKSAILRVNDRGPFHKGRIIDLSKASAEALGVIGTGTAPVRVQYLAQETEQYWASMNLDVPRDVEFTKKFPYVPPAGSPLPGGGVQPGPETDPSPEAGGTTTASATLNNPGVENAAPLMSVASSDLNAPQGQPPAMPEMKIRPIQPRFSVVSDAEAAESPFDKSTIVTREPETQGGTVKLSREEETSSAADVYQPSAPAEPKIVRASDAPEPGQAAVVRPLINSAPAAIATNNEMRVASLGEPPRSTPRPLFQPSASGNGKWYIQVGSFAEAANAEKIAARLKSTGTVDTRPVEASGRQWHRVRVGPFASQTAANAALAKVQSLGAPDARVVKN